MVGDAWDSYTGAHKTRFISVKPAYLGTSKAFVAFKNSCNLSTIIFEKLQRCQWVNDYNLSVSILKYNFSPIVYKIVQLLQNHSDATMVVPLHWTCRNQLCSSGHISLVIIFQNATLIHYNLQQVTATFELVLSRLTRTHDKNPWTILKRR